MSEWVATAVRKPARSGHRRPRRRIPRWVTLIGLAVALAAAARVLTMPEPGNNGRQPARGNDAAIADVYKGARIVKFDGRLSDDRAFTPWYHVDAETSVGTALTGDGATMRLLVHRADGSVRELMRLPAADNPQFNGLTSAGDDVFWMVSGGDAEGRSHSTLYRANWRQGTPATALTSDTGDVVYFNSQYDIVVADGQVRWAASQRDQPVTDIRSIPVSGGTVAVQKVDGAYAMSAWPWLTSAGSTGSGPVELRNLATGQRIAVPASANDVVTCGPVWCRILGLGPNGQVARTDLMHPDGTGRIKVAAGAATAAALDVALLDRFEVLSITSPSQGDTSLKVVMYDIKANRSVVLAEGVATVQARGPMVWWSTGEEEAVTWYALDLRTLP
jgi:hypothetical protein